MKAFNNEPEFKEQLLRLALEHEALDHYIAGTYNQENDGGEFRGCSVGCTINDVNRLKGLDGCHDDHAFLAVVLGVPLFIVNAQESIFEGSPHHLRIPWTYRFLKAIPVGADLTPVKTSFPRELDRLFRSSLPPETLETAEGAEARADLLIKLIKECS